MVAVIPFVFLVNHLRIGTKLILSAIVEQDALHSAYSLTTTIPIEFTTKEDLYLRPSNQTINITNNGTNSIIRIQTNEEMQFQESKTTTTTISIDDAKHEQNLREPRIYLHIGPHKVGSTTIQRFLHQPDVMASLSNDGIAIPTFDDMPGQNQHTPDFNWAHCMIRNYRDDGGNMGIQRCQRKTLPATTAFLNRTYHTQQDVLLVAEDLDRDTIDLDRLVESLSPYKDIRVVVTYRRLHDWYKSWYSEIVKMYLRTYIEYPQNFPSFVAWMENQTMIQKHTEALEERYTQHGFPVQVLHYHRNEPLMENVLCTTIYAPHTCEAIRNHTLSGDNFRESRTDLELCRWLLTGKAQNGIRRTQQCYDQAAKLQENLHKRNMTERDLPLLRVPPSTIEMVWNQTVKLESKYWTYLGMGKKPNATFWEDLRRDFDHAIERKWYSIDVHSSRMTDDYGALLF